MKKFLIKEYLPLLVSIISVFALSLFWENISLTYNKDNEIFGNYSTSNHHQFNDTLRFTLFILIPLLLYLLTFIFIDKENVLTLRQIIDQNKIIKPIVKRNNTILYFFIPIFFFYSFFSFFIDWLSN